MGTLGTRTLNGKKPGGRRVQAQEPPHPALAKLAIALRDYKEAVEQQAATADILRALSRSSSDPRPVFEAIVARAHRLCGGVFSVVYRYDGAMLDVVADSQSNPRASRILRGLYPLAPQRGLLVGRAVLERRTMHSADCQNDARFPANRPNRDAFTKLVPYRAGLAVPLLRDGEVVGAIFVARLEPRPFTKKEVGLVQTFAEQAVIAIQNAKMFREIQDRNAELKQSLEFQGASGEILASISSSIANTKPVFDAIVRNVVRLFGTKYAAVFMLHGDQLELAALKGDPFSDGRFAASFPQPVDHRTLTGKVLASGKVLQLAPIIGNPEASEQAVELARRSDYNAMIVAPMIREGKIIGAIGTARSEPMRFDEKQVALIKAFADQAVIAIENARLFNETKEALERQTATSQILQVISSAPANTQPVFDAIVQSAQRLMSGRSAALLLRRDSEFFVAAYSAPGLEDTPAEVRTVPLDREKNFPSRVILDGEILHIPDWSADDVPEHERMVAKAFGFGSGVQVPLLREGQGIGALVVERQTKGQFHEKETALLRSFADQVVIAIENARLINETKEALEQQKATSQVLGVISSSPTDVAPTYRAILDNVTRLCDANIAALFLYDGEFIRAVAHHNATAAFAKQLDELRARPSRETPTRLAALERRIVQVEDVLSDATFSLTDAHRHERPRTVLSVPMLREGALVGVITVWRREPRRFTDKQVALVRTFADQAVIAIENVRLFNDTKEALERQTATAEILRVISSSPNDVRPVFDTIVRNFVSLCGGLFGAVFTYAGELVHYAGSAGFTPEQQDGVRAKYPVRVDDPSVISARAILTKATVHVHDALLDPHYDREHAAVAGWRRMLAVPMLRDGVPLGAIVAAWGEAGATPKHHEHLLKTFADQAVIAIENVRLFKELEARTEALTKSVNQLTALGEVGQAITSTLDLETVLKTIVQRAVQLTGLDGGSIYEYDERTEEFRLQAAENMEQELVEAVRRTPVRKGDGAIGRSAVTLEPVQVADILDEGYRSARKEVLVRTGYRAILVVPLLREDHMLGAILVHRRTPGSFAPEVVELLKTFATQSAMAIQNARLFREIAEKGTQLEVASRHKSDFLASMSHELRTPLNALLGFNEMILGDIYGEVPADMKPPLAQMQSSGKHLLRLINNVLDLAKIEAGRMELALSDYSVHETVESVRSTLQPLAADKGLEFLAAVPADIPLAHGDPGRITQCLMNLAGNSLKFTKAGKVEISVVLDDGWLRYRVADTGIGIAPEKIASLFTEFKQTDATIASEYGGTGLGLSISKKFVEMHGGRIWVESEPGKGSAFIFEIPLRAKTP